MSQLAIYLFTVFLFKAMRQTLTKKAISHNENNKSSELKSNNYTVCL